MEFLKSILRNFMVFQALFLLITSLFVAPLAPFLSIYLLFFTKYWWLVIFYCSWMIYDRKTPMTGGRSIKWIRGLNVWKYVCDYFPISLIKTAQLPPDKNYIFAAHPHGLMCMGFYGSFGNDMCGFADLFPNLKMHLCMLKAQFWFPLRREYLLSLGGVDVSAESISHILGQGSKGNVTLIVVGGAKEVLNARPGCYDFVLNNRKGFIRLALKHGASLVPVISFGEPDLFDQVYHPPWLRNFQDKFRNMIGVVLPLFYGRWRFLPFLLMPYQRPIFTVVGAPIEVQKLSEIRDEDVDNLHEIYVEKLTELFETNKCIYGVPKGTFLNIT